ncbi:hypothetical protein [Rurimicrobium arvi]|uniref:Outer membrane protein beta-barrel domain-containing protein n=1 Tax=Rurimicrobium arvi TaxID=2049916 RepID=A0ABP8N2U7_9BACT
MEPNEKHIDDLFRQEMEGFRETPPDAVWESLEQRLDAHVATGKSPGGGGMSGWLWGVLTLAVVTAAIFGYRQFHKEDKATPDEQVAFSENVPSGNTTAEDEPDVLSIAEPESPVAVPGNTVPDGNGTEQPLPENVTPAGSAAIDKSEPKPASTPDKQTQAKQAHVQDGSHPSDTDHTTPSGKATPHASASTNGAAAGSSAGTAAVKQPATPGNVASTVSGKVKARPKTSEGKAAPDAVEHTKQETAAVAPDKTNKSTREAISPSPATGDKRAVRETAASSAVKVTDSAARDGNATRPAGIRNRTENAAVAQKETRQASSAVKDSAARELTRNGKTVGKAMVESPSVKTKEQATPHKTAEMGSGIAATSDKAVVGANKEAIQATASKDAKAPTVNGKPAKQKAVADSSAVAERQLLSSVGNKAGGNVRQSKSAVVTPEKSAAPATKKDRTTASVTPDAAAKSGSGSAEKIAGRKTKATDKAVTEDSSGTNRSTATADAQKTERIGAQSEEKQPAAVKRAVKQNSKPQASVGTGALAGGAGTKPKPGFVAADKAKRSAAKPEGAPATQEPHDAAVWLSYVGTYRDFRAARPSADLLTGSAFPQPEPAGTKSSRRRKKKEDLSTAKAIQQDNNSPQSGKSATGVKRSNSATVAATGNTLKQNQPADNPGNKTAKDDHTAGSAGSSGASAPAAAGSSAPHAPRGFAFQAGILGGVEKGFAQFSAQKTALSAFFEWTVGAKWGIGISPAYKWARTSQDYSLSDGSYVSPGATDVTVFDQTRDSFGTYTGYGSYAFAQKYDSMVATRQLQRNYREFELPLWVSYHVTKNWTVLAGVQLTWGSIPVFQGSVQTFTGLSLTDTVRRYYDTAYIGPAAPDKFAHKGVDSFSSYKSPSSDPVLKPVRGGYILGLRYTHRYGISAEATIRQNISGLSGVADPTLKQLMSQPYIRISIGYQIGRSGKSRK